MNTNTNDKFDRHIKDISIEEFDHITDGVEDHVFSSRYLAGKEMIMNNAKFNIYNLPDMGRAKML